MKESKTGAGYPLSRVGREGRAASFPSDGEEKLVADSTTARILDCFASLAKTHQTENQRAAKLRDDRSRNFVADFFIARKNNENEVELQAIIFLLGDEGIETEPSRSLIVSEANNQRRRVGVDGVRYFGVR